MPTLYLVPTPLADPDDITLRAIRILREASAVASDAPDATQALLDHHEIATPIIGYDDALDRLRDGDVALVKASGTPGHGGAAHEVVVAAIAGGVRVEPLPGASAAITALVLSGLPTDAFAYFDSVLDDLERLASDGDTLVFRADDLLAALDRLLDAFGNRDAAVAVNLTRSDEVVYRDKLSAAISYFGNQEMSGEALITLAGAPPPIPETWDEARVRAELRKRLATGKPLKQVAKAIAAEAGWDRRTVYGWGVEEKQQ